ncbi:glycosyltransferase family 9 protein [Desulfovibrio sp.]
MPVQLMRFIDFWLGAPCCLLLTLWLRAARLFRRPRPRPERLRRVIFIQLAESGAFVAAHAAMRRLEERHPGAEPWVLTFGLGGQVLDALRFPRDRRIVIRTSGLWTFCRDTLAAVVRMRALAFDATVNLETFARFSTLLAALSGAQTRAGFFRFHDEGRYTGGLLTHRLVYSPHMHAAQTYAALVESLAEEPGQEPAAKVPVPLEELDLPRVASDPALRARVEDTLRGLCPEWEPSWRLVLLNVNASDMAPNRRWPVANYLELATRLAEPPDVLAGFIGAPGERTAIEELLGGRRHSRIVNLAGKTSMPELLELFNAADLLVSNDSGPAHLAGATDIDVIVLFGPETPKIFRPLGPRVRAVSLELACSPCISAYNQKRSPCRDNRCMKGISVESVFELARAALGKRS